MQLLRESSQIENCQLDKENRVIRDAVLIKAGVSQNNNYYSEDLLQNQYQIFENSNGFFGHESGGKYRTDPRNLSHVVKNVRYDNGVVYGDLHYLKSAEPYLLESLEQKELLGLSVCVYAKSKAAILDGKPVKVVSSFVESKENSVDFVVNPAAGGRIFESSDEEGLIMEKEMQDLITEETKKVLSPVVEKVEALTQKIESLIEKPKEEETKPSETAGLTTETLEARLQEESAKNNCKIMLAEMLIESNLPAEAQEKIRSAFDGKIFEASAVTSEIQLFKKMLGRLEDEEGKDTNVDVGQDKQDRLRIALEAFVGADTELGDVKPFKDFKEAYVAFTGDVDFTGQIRLNESQTKESAFSITSFPYVMQDALNKKLLKGYASVNDDWKKFCNVSSSYDFKSQKRVNTGYFGDMPQVYPDVENYPLLELYSDSRVDFVIKQYGGLVPITRRAIINDDLNGLSRIVGNLGRSCARTMQKRIYVDNLHDNPAFADNYSTSEDGHTSGGTGRFFSSNRTIVANRNLGNAALSETAINETITLMNKMVEPGSGERFGGGDDFLLIVPVDLRGTAIGLNQKNSVETYNPIYHMFGANNERIIVSKWLTDATDWYLVRPQSEMDWIEVSFLFGKETPEIMLADNPLVGDMFVADRMVYKVRYEYEVVLLDPRGAYKHVVAN